MDNYHIGRLRLMDIKNWIKFKKKYPELFKELDYAVVKFIYEEGKVLIEEDRLKKVLDNYSIFDII